MPFKLIKIQAEILDQVHIFMFAFSFIILRNTVNLRLFNTTNFFIPLPPYSLLFYSMFFVGCSTSFNKVLRAVLKRYTFSVSAYL